MLILVHSVIKVCSIYCKKLVRNPDYTRLTCSTGIFICRIFAWGEITFTDNQPVWNWINDNELLGILNPSSCCCKFLILWTIQNTFFHTIQMAIQCLPGFMYMRKKIDTCFRTECVRSWTNFSSVRLSHFLRLFVLNALRECHGKYNLFNYGWQLMRFYHYGSGEIL